MDSTTKLSPPWYTLRKKLFYTIGKTPCVYVGELEEQSEYQYLIKITVTSCIYQAENLRIILPESYPFGNISVLVKVYYYDQEILPQPISDITPEQLAYILCCALKCNPYVRGAIVLTDKIPPIEQQILGSVSLVIYPKVIQFYNDDISDLCSNFNDVATDVFASVLNTTYGLNSTKLSLSTYDPDCEIQKNLTCYCYIPCCYCCYWCCNPRYYY